jgi:hypothetical protein
MTQDKQSPPPTWLSLTQSFAMDAPPPLPFVKEGMQFDATAALSDLKKLQDPAKFQKARFEFRLYRRN